MHNTFLTDHPIKAIFRGSWYIVKQYRQFFTLLALIFWVSTQAITYFISVYLPDLPLVYEGQQWTLHWNIDPIVLWNMVESYILPFWLAILVIAIVALILYIAIMECSFAAAENRPLSPLAAIVAGTKKLGIFVGTNLLQWLSLAGLFLLFIIPGLIYSIYWLFTNMTVIYSGKSWKDALDESKSIVQGRRWDTLGYLFVIFMIVTLVHGLVIVILQWLISFAGDPEITQAVITLLQNIVQVYVVVLFVSFFLRWEKTRVKIT